VEAARRTTFLQASTCVHRAVGGLKRQVVFHGVVRKKKGRLKGLFRAKLPVRKGKTAILTSRQ